MNGVGVGVGLRVGGIGVQVGRALVAVGLGLEVGMTVGVTVTRTTQGVAVASETCASLTFILASTVASMARSWPSLASTVASMSVLEQATSAKETNVVSPIKDR
jgi:hypothetical protein